ncbi:hypothetical protein L6452_19008 [Arctium lappa]|uniref:Uncharacterized protein n=1 Tax=Arctium lappa TaxID=4217 RepID=A0ACB9B881_ARCLA|nr:hypothetical protein L6452_19008 [Arctium lappa]
MVVNQGHIYGYLDSTYTYFQQAVDEVVFFLEELLRYVYKWLVSLCLLCWISLLKHETQIPSDISNGNR